jgi:hypothetical protein
VYVQYGHEHVIPYVLISCWNFTVQFLGIYAFCFPDGGKIKKPLSRRQKQRARKREKKLAQLAEKTEFSIRKGRQLMKPVGM